MKPFKSRIKRTYKSLKKKLNRKKTKRQIYFVLCILILLSALLINNAKDNKQKLRLMQEVHVRQQDTEIKTQVIETKTLQVQEAEKKALEIEQQKIQTEQKLKETEQKVQDLEVQVKAKKANARYASFVKQASVPVTNKQRGSSSGNTYAYGYCTWGVKNWRPDLPNNLGNADTWYSRAAAQGFAVGSTPRVGAVAATKAYMHVAYVIGVNGNQVTIREMNAVGWNVVSIRTAPASEFNYIY